MVFSLAKFSKGCQKDFNYQETVTHEAAEPALTFIKVRWVFRMKTHHIFLS